MKNFSITGIVTFKPLLQPSEGSVCIYKNEIVTLSHLDIDDHWITTTNQTIEHNRYLKKIQLLTKTLSYPIAVKSWKTILNNDYLFEGTHEFIIKPLKFKEGKHMNTCSNCNSHFMASKTQPYCEGCCLAHATAHIPKVIKEKVLGFSKIRKLLVDAFEIGQANIIGRDDFNNWVNKNLK